MSQRMAVKFKMQLGEALSNWYKLFGTVAERKPYHEEDQGGSDSGAAEIKPLFAEHPLFMEMPIGASSDLTSIINNDQQTLEEAEQRSDELSEELQARLSFQLKQQKQYRHDYYYRPRPF